MKGLDAEIHHENADDVAVCQFIVQLGAAPTISKLEQSLQEVMGLYQEVHHEDVDDDGVGQFIVQHGRAPTTSKLE